MDAYKELTPVIYGKSAVKYLHFSVAKGKMCFQMHWHDRMEILYVTEWSLELFATEGRYWIHAGQIGVVSPRQMHSGFAGNEGVDYHVNKPCNGS